MSEFCADEVAANGPATIDGMRGARRTNGSKIPGKDLFNERSIRKA